MPATGGDRRVRADSSQANASLTELRYSPPNETKGATWPRKADFTDEEWEALHKGVTGPGMLVSTSDPDFTDSFGEASALAKQLAAEGQNNQNPLAREIAQTHGTGFGMTSSREKVAPRRSSLPLGHRRSSPPRLPTTSRPTGSSCSASRRPSPRRRAA